MTIIKTQNDTALTLKIEGRLDTVSSPQLEQELQDSLPGITDLILDFENVEYISSAGLRILLMAQKVMNRQGQMTVTNVRAEVKEIFDITNFSDFLTIQ